MSKADKRERQRENRERAREERERLLRRDKRLRALRGLLLVLVPVALVFAAFQLFGSDGGSKQAAAAGCKAGTPPTTAPKNTVQQAPAQAIDPAKKYSAVMDTSCGVITLALDPVAAPIATNNFVSLARQGFYDGTTFHRAAKGFVIQGGDPKGDGSGGPGYSVKGEVPTDNYPVGALAAAKTGAEPAGTMGSQFFVVTGAGGATLPNDYARFGKVTAGLDVAKKIEALAPASGDGVPTKKVVVFKVTITES